MTRSWTPSYKMLAVLVIVVTIIALASGVIGLYSIQAELIAHTGHTLSLTAADIAQKLDLVLVERYGDIQVMADALAPSLMNDSERLAPSLSAMKQASPVYLWLGVADTHGRVLAATEPSTVGIQLDGTWLARARDGKAMQVVDVAPYIAAGRIDAVSFTAPIRGPQDEIVGYASARVGLPVLEAVVTRTLQEFQARSGLVGAIEYQLLTGQGDVVIDSDSFFKGTVNLVDLGLPSARVSESSQPGYVEEVHVRRQVPVVTGYAQTRGSSRVEGLQWRVLVRMDRQELLAPVQAILRKIGAVGVFVMAPLLLALIWTSRRLADEWAQARIRDRAVVATSKGMFVTDAGRPHHPILFANPAFLLLTRYSADEVSGLSPSFLIGPETDPAATEKLTAALREGRPCRTVVRHYRKDGTSFWNEVTLSPVRNDQGKVTEFIWVLADVSDRHEVEQALRTSEARLRMLASQVPVGIFTTDLHGNYLYVNERWCALAGLTPHEAGGPGWARALHPDDRARVVESWFRSSRDGGSFCADFRFQRSDGQISWVHGQATALRNHAAEATGYIGTVVDITERKQAEAALRDSEAFNRSVLNSLSTHIAVLDQDGTIIAINDAWRQFAVSDGETCLNCSRLGTNCMGICHATQCDEASAKEALAGIEAVRIGRRADFSMEYPCHSQDQRRWFAMHVIPLEGSNGGLVISHEDIAARKQAEHERARLEAQVRHVQKMDAIGTLAGGIAHEFNNSLTAILGFSELALQKIPADSKAHAQIKQVITAGRRARELVCQLLTFSRQAEQTKRPLSLHMLLKEALKLLRPTLPAIIELREHLAAPTAAVSADPTQIHQVLLNLWTNAEHAMRATGGTLDIGLDEVRIPPEDHAGVNMPAPGRYVRLTVKDTGYGMASDVKDRIFDPFFTTKYIGEGTGMGLAVVHGIVTGHGGILRVESDEGQGTTVEMYLPALPARESAAAPDDELLPRGHECILFVEDEASLARSGREMLDSLGYYSVVRAGAQEALYAFQLAPQCFDLVIADDRMSRMTGEALAHEFLKLRPELPILLLCSDSPQTVSAGRDRSSGIRGCLGKPLVLQEVAFAIRRALDGPARINGHASADDHSPVVTETEELDAISTRR